MDNEHLGHLVMEKELLNRKQLEECLRVQRERIEAGKPSELGDIIIKLGFLNPTQMEAVKAEELRRRHAFPGYEITGMLGTGRTGAVYRAKQLSLEREAAIKVLRTDLARNPDTCRKFHEEAKLVARLNHPHIVHGIDTGEAAGMHYFVMEYIPGGTLQDKLKNDGPLPERQAVRHLSEIASALDCAAGLGLVHCDVKPANMLLDGRGAAKLADLGIAEIGAERETTEERLVRGTPHYLSPEQIRCERPFDIRADLYALGASIYHLATGQTPFKGEKDKEIALARLTAPVPDAHAARPELSEGFALLLKDMMAVDRAKRIASPSEVLARAAALDKSAGSGINRSIQLRPTTIKQPTKLDPTKLVNPKMLAAIAAIAVLVFAGIMLKLLG